MRGQTPHLERRRGYRLQSQDGGRRRATRRLAWVLLSLFMAASQQACSPVVGRDYHPPLVATPEAYAEATPAGSILADWWTALGDEQLSRLVARGLQANLTVRHAFAHLAEERELLGVADAAYGPSVNASTGVHREGLSQHIYIPFRIPPFTEYQAGFDASWEIDLWGAVRREHEGALSELQAQEWTTADVLNTVSSDIVRDYYQLMVMLERVHLAQDLVTSFRASLEVVVHRLHAGLVTEDTVENLVGQVARGEAAIPPLLDEAAADRHALEVLIGVAPDSLGAELTATTHLPELPPALQVGIPADLLRRRPDIRIAEREIAAATARYGVADADFYPRLSLTGNFGLDSVDRHEFFKRSALSWGFGPSLGWNILDWGRSHHALLAADRQIDEALISYQAAILNAQRDVTDALWGLNTDQVEISALQESDAAAVRSEMLERARRAHGLSDAVLVNGRRQSSLQTQDALFQAKAMRMIHLVALAKALGGGWGPEIAAASSPTSAPSTPEKANP
jgi:NodT family efflux transporter outer membrane factor (OMF) lipoprotein